MYLSQMMIVLMKNESVLFTHYYWYIFTLKIFFNALAVLEYQSSQPTSPLTSTETIVVV